MNKIKLTAKQYLKCPICSEIVESCYNCGISSNLSDWWCNLNGFSHYCNGCKIEIEQVETKRIQEHR